MHEMLGKHCQASTLSGYTIREISSASAVRGVAGCKRGLVTTEIGGGGVDGGPREATLFFSAEWYAGGFPYEGEAATTYTSVCVCVCVYNMFGTRKFYQRKSF